jgi:hypothetical protein
MFYVAVLINAQVMMGQQISNAPKAHLDTWQSSIQPISGLDEPILQQPLDSQQYLKHMKKLAETLQLAKLIPAPIMP